MIGRFSPVRVLGFWDLWELWEPLRAIARRNAMFAGNGVCSSQSLDKNWGMVGQAAVLKKLCCRFE